MKLRWSFLLLVSSICLALWPRPSLAQDTSIQWQITPGFDGTYKSGAWFPVTITVSNAGPDLRGTLSVRLLTAQATTYTQPIDLPLNAQKRVVIPVASDNTQIGAVQADVTLRDGDTVVRNQRVRLNAVDTMSLALGVISDEASALPELSNVRAPQELGTTLLRLSGATLPDRAQLLQTLDVLFVHATDTSTWTDAQRTALHAWVNDGGKLVIGGDSRVISGVGDLLPATVAASDTITSSLARLSETRLGRVRDGAVPVRVLKLQPNAGADVLLRGDADQPLLVREQRGSGVVLISAFDLSALRDVTNINVFWNQALDIDIQGQPRWFQLRDQGFWTLQDALRLPALQLLSPLGLMGFLLAYILVVGPLNYAVLRRFDRREWAYVTIPLCVLLFSGSAYLWGSLGRGQNAVLNQLSIVRVPANATRGDATTYLTVFSPARRSYELGLATDALVTDLVPPWERQNRALDVQYAENSVQIPDLLVDVGAVRALVAEQTVLAPQLQATIGANDQITVRNQSDQTLSDLAVVRNSDRAQVIGSLAPGEERTIVFDPTRSLGDGLGFTSDGVIDRQVVLQRLAGSLPTAQTNTLHVLGWQSTGATSVSVDGRAAQVDGETLYMWSVEKDQ